jgi:uncharacterized membrane protein YraQ (UPF0718 family)
MTIINHSYHLLAEILPVFFIAILASSLIDKFVPDDFLARISSGKNLFITVLNASIIGALIPLCTCGMIPLTVKLHQKKLHWKALVAFLIAGNACSVPALILTANLSWNLALIRFIASIVFGVFCAYLLGLVAGKNFGLIMQDSSENKPSCCEHEHKSSLSKQVIQDLKEMTSEFLPWILLAILLALGFEYFFGANVVAKEILSNKTFDFASPIIASVIGFPFYFCAGADIPLSAEFLKLGVATGSVISFMLTAPGVNLTSLLVYQKAIGWKKAWIVILASIFCASVIGIYINMSAFRI